MNCALHGDEHAPRDCPSFRRQMILESYATYYAEIQEALHAELPKPYYGALYRNKRSGIEWQVQTSTAPGEVTLRLERRLAGDFGWFRWMHVDLDRLGRNFAYVGPTPRDHYLWGYDLSNPLEAIQ